MTDLLHAADESAALEELHAEGMTDGLPVIIPTEERVQTMIDRVDLDPDLVLGTLGPREGAASIRQVAVNTVMAGCLPDHFPVIIAAITALAREEFDLTEVNQTTHCVAPMVMVNGPARHECGSIESGFGILGPGNRASASIGRAVSLCLINIAGRIPGKTDLATFSNPAKFSCCFAEAEETSPFPPYHVSRGFEAGDSVTTVIGVEAPHSLICEPAGDTGADANRLLNCIAGILANAGSNHVYCGGRGGAVVLLSPEHAAMLANAGHDRQDIAAEICERATMNVDTARKLYGDLVDGYEVEAGKLRAIREPEQVMLAVAGGMGVYSAVIPSWGYAPHGNLPISEKIEVFPICPV